jgi:endonuclease/exonuclease/phosphatase family metal-dependent hydrolase
MFGLEEAELALDEVGEATRHGAYTSPALNIVVRTWNVFHGRTYPESRSLHLERMIRLVTADAPDVVALQEVPLWARAHLGEWSRMRVAFAVAKRAWLGPMARPLQALAPQLVRSDLTGQANALLLADGLSVAGPERTVVISPRGACERRVCQSVSVLAGGQEIAVVNVHASPDREQVARAVESVAASERCLLLGDFNLRRYRLPGFSEPRDAIDQILARGLEFERAPAAWPDERRRIDDGRLLSDHAPVEAVVAST